MNSYLLLRHLHITCAAFTVVLFVVRVLLTADGQNWRERWPVLRVLPHVIDTLLLGAGISLAVLTGQLPGPQQPWLLGKLGLLVVYIVAGRIALRAEAPQRRPATVVALLAVAGIVTLAMTRLGS